MTGSSRLIEQGGWPALLTIEFACRYLSLESAAFLRLSARWGIMPVDVEDGVHLWRRSDLDKLVRRLPTIDISSEAPGQRAIRLHPNDVDQLARAVAALLEAREPVQPRSNSALLTIPAVSRQLGISRSTIYRMIGEGKLEVRKIGNRTMITAKSVSHLIDP